MVKHIELKRFINLLFLNKVRRHFSDKSVSTCTVYTVYLHQYNLKYLQIMTTATLLLIIEILFLKVLFENNFKQTVI